MSASVTREPYPNQMVALAIDDDDTDVGPYSVVSAEPVPDTTIPVRVFVPYIVMVHDCADQPATEIAESTTTEDCIVTADKVSGC